jgi:hypothetical protein
MDRVQKPSNSESFGNSSEKMCGFMGVQASFIPSLTTLITSSFSARLYS